MAFNANDVALVVPTKDRPRKVEDLLESLVRQQSPPGRIIIVDGGKSVAHIVKGFSGRLPVEYYRCFPPSLIRQRNRGLAELKNGTPLVGFIDDDIVFEKHSLSEMVEFWNRTPENTAAVSFNIVNVPESNCGFLHRLFYLSDSKPGRVLKSGVTTTYHNLNHNVKTQWVCGGATIWRLDILERFSSLKEINSRWAVCEDLIFSYPIGKEFNLYLCSNARVRHEHNNDYHIPALVHQYVGYNEVLWRLYFVRQNLDMSTFAWFLYAVGRSCYNMWLGFSNRDRDCLKKAVGNVNGLYQGLVAMACGKDLAVLLDENTSN